MYKSCCLISSHLTRVRAWLLTSSCTLLAQVNIKCSEDECKATRNPGVDNEHCSRSQIPTANPTKYHFAREPSTNHDIHITIPGHHCPTCRTLEFGCRVHSPTPHQSKRSTIQRMHSSARIAACMPWVTPYTEPPTRNRANWHASQAYSAKKCYTPYTPTY